MDRAGPEGGRDLALVPEAVSREGEAPLDGWSMSLGLITPCHPNRP